jgi:hypothetical protein
MQNKNSNSERVYFKRFPSGLMLETLYDPKEEKTKLLVFEDKKEQEVDSYEHGGINYLPVLPTEHLIEGGHVKLPSKAEEYNSIDSLLNDVSKFIERYVDVPDQYKKIAVLYTVFSWIYDEYSELPYFRLIGDRGCGKSRMLKTMGSICYRGILMGGGSSGAVLYRAINLIKGTIIFDEADMRNSDTYHTTIKILNNGYTKGVGIFKVDDWKKSHGITCQNVFCPKIISTRFRFSDDALESRCLTFPMRATSRKDIPLNLDEAVFEEEALQIRNKLLGFRLKMISGKLEKQACPDFNADPRLRQIITPLYSFVRNKEYQDALLDFAERKHREMLELRHESDECKILEIILECGKTEERVTVQKIANLYNKRYKPKYSLNARKTGEIIGNTLHLKKQRGSNGYFVENCEENEREIEALKKKYGLN